jgi:hypothetical protein
MKNSKEKQIKEKQIKETAKIQKEKRDFKIALIIVISIVAILISSLFLPDLIKEWIYKSSLSKLKAEESYLVDEKGNKYYALNRAVEAVSTDGVFGLLGEDEYCFIDFMHEDGVPPAYIVEYKNQIKGTVLRINNAANITLANFMPVSADICQNTNDYPFDYFVAPDEYLGNGGTSRNDEEYVNMIHEALTTGEEVSPPMNQETALRIKLKSQKYPGLYYTVIFATDENGISYLCDLGSGKYVLCPDKLTVRLS